MPISLDYLDLSHISSDVLQPSFVQSIIFFMTCWGFNWLNFVLLPKEARGVNRISQNFHFVHSCPYRLSVSQWNVEQIEEKNGTTN